MTGDRVRLPDDFVENDVERLARERLAENATRNVPYGHSTIHGNKVGVRGEAAAMIWFHGHGFRLNSFKDRYRARNPDVRVGKPGPPWIAVEVKSWPSSQWERGLAHCVSAAQLQRVAERDWLVMWAIDEGTGPDGGEYVTLQGWTSTADLVEHGVAEWTAGIHANVRVGSEYVRRMADLVDADPQAVKFPSLRTVDMSCGHPNVLGMCWRCAEVPSGLNLPELVEVWDGQYHAVDALCPGHRPRGDVQVLSLFDAVASCGACLKCYPTTA